jgi:hypothetical protein
MKNGHERCSVTKTMVEIFRKQSMSNMILSEKFLKLSEGAKSFIGFTQKNNIYQVYCFD